MSDWNKELEATAAQDTLYDAISTYGSDMQLIVAIEELSELEKELCKFLRGKKNFAAAAEEYADVQIMLEQIKIILLELDPDFEDRVSNYTRNKLARLKRRVDRDR